MSDSRSVTLSTFHYFLLSRRNERELSGRGDQVGIRFQQWNYVESLPHRMAVALIGALLSNTQHMVWVRDLGV